MSCQKHGVLAATEEEEPATIDEHEGTEIVGRHRDRLIRKNFCGKANQYMLTKRAN
jgi:hypothetical protein